MDERRTKLLRFSDLKEANIVTSWPQLKRLVEGHGFPPGYLLSPAVRVWDEDAVNAWIQRRREAPALRTPANAQAAA